MNNHTDAHGARRAAPKGHPATAGKKNGVCAILQSRLVCHGTEVSLRRLILLTGLDSAFIWESIGNVYIYIYQNVEITEYLRTVRHDTEWRELAADVATWEQIWPEYVKASVGS